MNGLYHHPICDNFLIMGCANSKQKRCRHCSAPYSPVPRSYSVHVHHPPQSKEDSYHVVGLTSTTLGSLMDLSHKAFENDDQNGFVFSNASFLQENEKNESDVAWDCKNNTTEFPNGVVIEEPKTWSNEMMKMDQKKIPEIIIPKTPLTTPPGEPETINTWELMEGLEDTTSPFHHHHFRSFSFDVHHHPHKPMWLHMTEDDDESNSKIHSDFDPQVISSFNKSLQEISPGTPFHLRTAYNEKESGIKARKGLSFEPKKIDGKEKEDKVILYFTSLRGIRKTYEDCCHVRMILKGVGVRVDERDVSMHSGFKEELKELLGDGFYWGGLPRVFLGKHYIGGVEEIRKLHEDGQLEKLLDCCEKIDDNGGGGECEGCGDIRFVPCDTCSGSCKIYYEEEEEEEEDDDDDEVGDYGFQRCPDCNENGLIRCPICC